jgi:hypothetical protein
MGKKPRSGSGINIPGGHISKRLETIFWVKILKFFMQMRIREPFGPGSGKEKFGSGIKIPHPQHRL